MKLLDAVKSSSEYLEKAGLDDPFEEAEILVLHAAGVGRLKAYTDNPEIGKIFLSKIRRLIKRRAKGEPLQYIIGRVEFLGLTIEVVKGLLIPRPETELLAEEAIKTFQSSKPDIKSRISEAGEKKPSPLRILDLCAGSGCISLALAKAFPDADIHGTDILKIAIRYAKKNAALNNIYNVSFHTGSLYEPLKGLASFDLIISNPPYIRTGEIDGLQREIREWEPLKALDGGPDGLDFYRQIFSGAGIHLKKTGKVIVELGYGQAMDVTEVAKGSGFKTIALTKDFSGIDRILTAER